MKRDSTSREWLPTVLAWHHAALPVLALQSIFVLTLYWRSLRVGLLSDAWVVLSTVRPGLEGLLVPLGYHWIPVTNVLSLCLWKLCGLHGSYYQLLNLIEFGFVGWLLYLFGSSLLGRPRIALLASLFFLVNGAFYEVTLWPVIGNFHSLSAALYLMALLVVRRGIESGSWSLFWVFSAIAVAAFLTYEGTVSLVPVGLLYAAVRAFELRSGGIRRVWQRFWPMLPPVLVATVVITSVKLTFETGPVLQPGTLTFRLYLMVRGVIALFTLRGSDITLYSFFSLGRQVPASGAGFMFQTAGWLLVFAGIGAWVLWRYRASVTSFLFLWLFGHMALLSTVVGQVSRHYYLPALPASLLLALGIVRGIEWASAQLIRRKWAPVNLSPAAAGTAGGFFLLAVLSTGAGADRAIAISLHREATYISNSLVEQIRARAATAPPLRDVYLINVPAMISRDGVGCYIFVNGLREQLEMHGALSTARLNLRHTYNSLARGQFANGTVAIELGELSQKISDVQNLVLRFDHHSRSLVELNLASWQPPREYTAASAPYFRWEPGAWPWMRLYAGHPLELPVARERGPQWVALRFLRNATAEFEVTSEGRRLMYHVPGSRSGDWPTVTFALHETGETDLAGVEVLEIRPRTEVWIASLRTFRPQRLYSPETAPFLEWYRSAPPSWIVRTAAVLPLENYSCVNRTCTVRIVYLAEPARPFRLILDGVERYRSDGEGAPPAWRDLELPTEPGAELRLLEVDPLGAEPILIQEIGWFP